MNEEPENIIDDAPAFAGQEIEANNAAAAATELPDQLWLEFDEGSPVLLADNLKQRGARLIGLTAYPNYDGEATVCYHYVLPTVSGESVFNAKFITRNRLLASIAAIYPGAGWQEGAIGERYDVMFRDEAAPVAGMLSG